MGWERDCDTSFTNDPPIWKQPDIKNANSSPEQIVFHLGRAMNVNEEMNFRKSSTPPPEITDHLLARMYLRFCIKFYTLKKETSIEIKIVGT